MFKNLTIGKQIGLGFGVVLLMLAVVAILSYTSVTRITETIQARSSIVISSREKWTTSSGPTKLAPC